MTERTLTITFNDDDIGVQQLAANIGIDLERRGFAKRFDGECGIRIVSANPNYVPQQKMIPYFGHLRERSRVNAAIRSLSGIAYPHVDGGNGGGA